MKNHNQAAPGAVVEIDRVTVRYSDRRSAAPAVDDLSLSVLPSEVCVLVGPSGCGKTTTLRLVNRLAEPTSGRVLIDGQDIAAQDPVALRRRTGYVVQQIGLFPHLTVGDNIATVPRLLGWADERIHDRVAELLGLIGLDPGMTERYPAQLSGGERQRVGVARALAAEPPLLLMDEPFAAVDPLVRTRLQDEFLRLQRALGTTVLFVTHDVDEAVKLASRVAVMRTGGRLAQYASPAEVLAHPADEYVARFVGADRALKRLALMPVGALRLEPPPRVRRVGSLPTVDPAASAREGLAVALASSAGAALVMDSAGRALGILTLPAIAAGLAESADALRLQAAGAGHSAGCRAG